MQLHCWKQKIIRWFFSTPHRSSNRAYEASKQLQPLIYDSPLFVQVESSPPTPGDLSWAAVMPTNTASRRSKYLIYCSLLEHRFSTFTLGMQRNLRLVFRTKLFRLILFKCYCASNSFTKKCLNLFLPNLPDILLLQNLFLNFHQKCCMHGEIINRRGTLASFSEDKLETNLPSRGFYKLNSIKKRNRKLAWIEATLNELDATRARWSINSFSCQITKKVIEKSFNYELANFPSAYESISLVPRSVTRTLSRFGAELTNQSSMLVRNDFDLTRNQALVSFQYVGCFLLLPLTIPISFRNWFLESWIRGWWDVTQTQVFTNAFQEERALKQLREAEALLWLDNATECLADKHLRNFDANAYNEATQLAAVYDELNIQLLLQLVTNLVGVAILALFFITGRKRLAVLNSRIQESFYSLDDTMKAFSILSLTDLCVGFHSPHGWEIAISTLFEHFGLIPDKYVISRLVSTFPVILDTVFKYWIFRHLNRTSPSIVATYHTMSG
uniref:Potassium/proton antiporter CemA n=2 Tax=Pyrrosia TaxID=156491 RepID=A0A3G6IP45_9MONI|nr:chloroplast envelope membrane protein [Pyrrosia bonii]YP_009774211.1 envelope membrane carbon uptake protein [Pyrrosia subfurfuracea]AZA06619.1 chloroplast envelope membrane protein [Pyrrosia bonii]QIZ74824.1 envelope membrane carbon uptake protein [Pyrrosia subfurfuracea]